MLSSEYLGLAVVMLHLLSSFSFFKDNKRMRRTLEEEQRARKELERIIRRVLKNMNDPSWDETNLWDQHLSQDSRQDCFLTLRGQKSNEMLSNYGGPNWTISKDSLLSSEAKLAGRCDDITLQCAALPYYLLFLFSLSVINQSVFWVLGFMTRGQYCVNWPTENIRKTITFLTWNWFIYSCSSLKSEAITSWVIEDLI